MFHVCLDVCIFYSVGVCVNVCGVVRVDIVTWVCVVL